MPRNACSECRNRKAKCLMTSASGRCERCVSRELPCSFTNNSVNLRLGGSRSRGHRDNEPVHIQPPPAPAAVLGPSHQSVRTTNSINSFSDYQIGSGTPSEILREGELCKEVFRLYFANFSDINFLFEETSFMHDFDMGYIPQTIIFSMLALGVRFSDASCFKRGLRCHRGDQLIKKARELLKDDFDHVTPRGIQSYILQSTYWLTFGAARKAWLYLGIATTMAKSLRLADNSFQTDLNRDDSHRRIVCNLVLLDRILSPSLNMHCNYSLNDTFQEPYTHEALERVASLDSLGRNPDESHSINLSLEIFRLSHVICGLVIFLRKTTHTHTFEEYEQIYLGWQQRFQGDLIYNSESFDTNQRKGTLRQFLFLHLLYHHIGQILYFPALGAGSVHFPPMGRQPSHVELCQYHAKRVSEIVEDGWKLAGIDIHNTCCGQILTVSCSVHMYSCLRTSSVIQKESSRASIDIIISSFLRVRKHTRIFDRMLIQLNSFFKICNETSMGHIFDNNTRLLRHIMHYGTVFERYDNRGNGEISRLREREIDPTTVSPNNDAFLLQEGYQDLDWLLATNEPSSTDCQNFDWLFSEASLNDLYSMAYIDPEVR